jgi:hypothetical protein
MLLHWFETISEHSGKILGNILVVVKADDSEGRTDAMIILFAIYSEEVRHVQRVLVVSFFLQIL